MSTETREDQPVSYDQNGWDCLIEFPPLPSDGPPDLGPPGLAILAQVKSSENAKQSCAISLSNALKYAQHALPCFIVLAAPDKQGRPAAYIRHVWDDALGDILKRVREAHLAGVPLYRRRMTITFTDADRFDEDAVKQMALILDELGPKYATRKQALYDTLGYEHAAGTGNLIFDKGVDPETLVDLALGLVESVPIARFTYHDTRFGLTATKPDIDQAEGLISMTPTAVADCQVTIRDPDSDAEINLPGQVFSPGIPHLPREFWKLRIKTSVLDVVLPFEGKGKVSSKIDLDARRSLSELMQTVTVWSWASRGGLEMQIWSDGRLMSGSRMEMDPMDDGPHWRRLHRVLGALTALAPEGRWPDGIGFSLRFLFEKTEVLSEFRALLQDDGVKLDFVFEGEIPQPERIAVPIFLQLDDYLFTAVMDRPVATMEQVGSKVFFALGPPTIRRGAILKGTSEEHMKFIDANLRASRDVLAPGVMMIAPPDDDPSDQAPNSRS